MKIVYFGRITSTSNVNGLRRSKTHIVDEYDKPICGTRPLGEAHFVSASLTFSYVECKACRAKMKEVNMDSRPGWDDYFMTIANATALRATCDRAIIGAVIVKDNSIIATGYNGAPRGLPHCDEVGHLMDNGHCVRTVHAEMNAVIQAAIHGSNTEGGTVYTTHFPCFLCCKILINAGIKRIVYLNPYRIDERALVMFSEAGVIVSEYVPK